MDLYNFDNFSFPDKSSALRYNIKMENFQHLDDEQKLILFFNTINNFKFWDSSDEISFWNSTNSYVYYHGKIKENF